MSSGGGHAPSRGNINLSEAVLHRQRELVVQDRLFVRKYRVNVPLVALGRASVTKFNITPKSIYRVNFNGRLSGHIVCDAMPSVSQKKMSSLSEEDPKLIAYCGLV